MASIPPQLKLIKPVLLRAAEMDKAPVPKADLIAYCCRRHAMQKIISSESRSDPAVAEYLGGLMDRLENDNPKLKEKYPEEFASKENQIKVVQEFAMNSFKGLEQVYKNGKATMGTAKSYLAVSAFFDVVGQDKTRLACKFVAKQIMDAIKEGRTPMPPVVEEEEEAPEDDFGFGEPVEVKAVEDDPYGFESGLPALNEFKETSTNQFSNPPSPINLPTPPLERADSLDDDDAFVPPRLGQMPVNAQLSVRGREFMKQVNPSANFGAQSDMECLEAQGFARKAVDFIKKNQYAKVIECLCDGLKTLEHRRPQAAMFSGGLREEAKLDIVEYLLFAARTLECAGQLMSVQEAKARATDLFKQALNVAQRG